MEPIALLLVLFSLLGSAVSVDCGKAVYPKDGPYCTFTDAWRQFNYTCTIGHLVNLDNTTVKLYAYNWTCQEIGTEHSVEIGKTFNFDAQLHGGPVVVTFNDSVHPPSFTYAGKQYGQNATGNSLPDPVCYNSGGQRACETQFDCGKEVNMADFEGGRKWRETFIGTQELQSDMLGSVEMSDALEWLDE